MDAGNSVVVVDNLTSLFSPPTDITIALNKSTPANDTLPPELLTMSERARNSAMAYGFLFLISATGNLSVFMSVLNQLRKTKSRICLLILHLSVADLLVTFLMMPMEIVWRITVGWYGGTALCKVCQFFRAFGLHLSSNVLICISLDRYFAILHPLRTSGAKKRGRVMLAGAWIAAALCSTPQIWRYTVVSHPRYPAFQQCVSPGFVSEDEDERLNTIASVGFMYFLPLFVIIFTYGRIIRKMNRKSREHRESCRNPNGSHLHGRIVLRRSDATNNLDRAKRRTLKLTLVIVLVFVMCWTPYVIMTLWYMLDRDNAVKVDRNVQEALFLMAVANSCVNPLVYGSYTRECRETMCQCCITESSRRKNQRVAVAATSSRTVTTSLDNSVQPRNRASLRDTLTKCSKKNKHNHSQSSLYAVNNCQLALRMGTYSAGPPASSEVRNSTYSSRATKTTTTAAGFGNGRDCIKSSSLTVGHTGSPMTAVQSEEVDIVLEL